MLRILRPLAYASILISSIFLIHGPSPENMHVKQTKDSRKIYKEVKKIEDELYAKLKDAYVPHSYFFKNDTLTINYQKSDFNNHSAHCGAASGILKKILNERGIKTEYVVLRGLQKTESITPLFYTHPAYRGIPATHIFLKTGETYIDPTWWQFFDDAGHITNRIAVGTKENLQNYYLKFNNSKSLLNKNERMNRYFILFREPDKLDPNYMLDYAAALYAETSCDTIKIPVTYDPQIDCFMLQNLEFFKERTINTHSKIKGLEEIFIN